MKKELEKDEHKDIELVTIVYGDDLTETVGVCEAMYCWNPIDLGYCAAYATMALEGMVISY